MKNKKRSLIILVIGICLLASACTDTNKQKPPTVSAANYKQLEIGMAKSKVIEIVGEPQDDIGFGVSIFLYHLNKDEGLVVYFDTSDKLSKIDIVDKE